MDKRPPNGPESGPGGWGPIFLKWLDANFPDTVQIVEFGSGLGTRELTRRGHEVHSVEHNPEWVGVAGKSTYYHAPIKQGWYDPVALVNLPTTPALCIIDGPPGTIGRSGILHHKHLFENAGVILVDDYNRKPEQLLAGKISKHLKRPITTYRDGLKSFAVI